MHGCFYDFYGTYTVAKYLVCIHIFLPTAYIIANYNDDLIIPCTHTVTVIRHKFIYVITTHAVDL